MPTLKNFVAVDWRAGKDKIYFFFKDSNTYSRFDLGENKVDEGYPAEITADNWGSFHAHVKDLRFGFTVTGVGGYPNGGDDILWLFYYANGTPMVCKYDQDYDKVTGTYRLEDSLWHSLLPYFDRIVAGTWWEIFGHKYLFKFLTNDGHYINFNYTTQKTSITPITSGSWPGLDLYKNQIITAVQNDAPLFNSYFYIFLTNNRYIRYNINDNRAETGPTRVDDDSWPGLIQD